nr:MAG TPA: hypothetical protein [Caudoviricetes sp.]
MAKPFSTFKSKRINAVFFHFISFKFYISI